MVQTWNTPNTQTHCAENEYLYSRAQCCVLDSYYDQYCTHEEDGSMNVEVWGKNMTNWRNV